MMSRRAGGGLTHASANLESRYGRVAVGWRIVNGRFELDVEIPPSVTAAVTLPDGYETEVARGSERSPASGPAEAGDG